MARTKIVPQEGLLGEQECRVCGTMPSADGCCHKKEVLAWILKNTAEEFKDLSLEEIEGMPEVSSIP